MDSQKLQEIILSTIEDVAQNLILSTNYLTLINGQISKVDQFNNYYNFVYQKEEYTGFSITGEKYSVGDLVYVLKLNNNVNAKQMIISKVNSYTNFDIELAINDTIEQLKQYVEQVDLSEKQLSIIGNTVFTLNDDLTITPETLTFSAQKTGKIDNVRWFIDGVEQVQDELQKLTISNELVRNKDSLDIRVEDYNNAKVKDEITVIRALKADTKLEFDLGLDSVLLDKNEKGEIDYSKAILTPKVFSDGEDVTASQNWSIDYKVENGELTIIKEGNTYKITQVNTNLSKISFFAKKDGNMYLQKVIYITVVSNNNYNLNITASNQNFVIPLNSIGETKRYIATCTIKATRGTKVVKIYKKGTPPALEGVEGEVVENSDGSITFNWDILDGTVLEEENGNLLVNYLIENTTYETNILWTSIKDGDASIEYSLDINPKNILKNGDNTFTPAYVEINSYIKKGEEKNPYNGYIKIYKTVNNTFYSLEYENAELENSYTYSITDVNLKAIKIDFYNEDNELIITEYCYVTINSDDFIETVNKTENNSTTLEQVEGKIEGLITKDTEIETTINNLRDDTETKFTEINEQYSSVRQEIDEVNTTVSNHEQEINTINGEIISQGERLSQAEEKITDDAIVSTVTSSEKWNQIQNSVNEAFENSKAIKLNASSTAFTKTKNSEVFTPDTITITPELKTYEFGSYEYATGVDLTFKKVINGEHGFKLLGNILTIDNASDLFTAINNSIIIKGNTSLNSAYDVINIIKISDGEDGTNGESSYTVILGNENFAISCLNNKTVATNQQIEIPIYTYIGDIMYSNTISIGNLPNGMTSTVENGTIETNGKIIININQGANLDNNLNGIIELNITVNNKVFNKQLTWFKSIPGQDGTDGSDGRDGISITSVKEYYQVSASNTEPPTEWKLTTPLMTKTLRYLWSYEEITYSDKRKEVTEKKVIGVYGDTGNGISSVINYYLISQADTGITTETPGWVTKPPKTTVIEKYLWNYEILKYTNGENVIVEPHIIGTHGTSGISVERITNYYLATPLMEGVTIETVGWTEKPQKVSETNKYLWNYETTSYSDKSSANTEPHIIGMYSKEGNGIEDIIEYYQVSSSNIIAPSEWIENDPPKLSPTNKYLWNYEKTIYTNGTSTETSRRVIGVYGDKGENGSDGVGIENSDISYQASDSGTEVPIGNWSPTIPAVEDGQFLWTRTIITYTNDETSTIYSVGKIAANGSDGNGISITEITYQASDSGTTVPTGTWTREIPTVLGGEYLWTRTIITYTDKSKSTSYSVSRNGADGAAGRVYILEPTTLVIKKTIENILLPSQITFSSYYRDGATASRIAYSGRFIIEEDDGNGYVKKYTSSSNENVKTYSPTTNAKTIKCTLYAAGGTTVALDVQTIAVIDDAEAAIRSDTPPENTDALWFDTTSNLLKYYNGTEWVVANDYAGDLNDMKQEITKEYTSSIEQLKDSINSLVTELQTVKTDNQTSINQLTSQILQNSDSISFVTSEINNVVDNITGLATKEEISKWARFQDGILELGASDSPFAVKLSNTELGFYQNGIRIAYLSNQQLNISQAVVMQQINLGTFQLVFDTVLGFIIK